MLAYISEVGRRPRRLNFVILHPTSRIVVRERGVIPGCIKPERQDTFLEAHNIKQWPKKANGEYDKDYYIDQYVEVTQRYITQKPMPMGYDEYKRKRDNIGLIRPIS